MPNIELLQLTLKTIKENPQHWNQENWHCGTSHCFAGFVELISNNIPIETDEDDLIKKHDLGETFEDLFDEKQFYWNTESYARQRLGITAHDADVLFFPFNTLKNLEEYVDTLIQEGSLKKYADPYC